MSVKLRYGLLLLVLVLSGCSKSWEATKKVGKVLWDPDIPVGKANQQPSEIAITLLAEPDMNPNCGEVINIALVKNGVLLTERLDFTALAGSYAILHR